jgi:hypothetical protein
MKDKRKQGKKQLWALAYILVLQTKNFLFSYILFFLCLDQLNFPSKWCHANATSNWFEMVLDYIWKHWVQFMAID